MKLRYAVTLGLIFVIIVLAIAAVSHIHGITDAVKAHTSGELFALDQVRTGFVAASSSTFVIVVTLLGWVTADSSKQVVPRPAPIHISRGPPRISL